MGTGSPSGGWAQPEAQRFRPAFWPGVATLESPAAGPAPGRPVVHIVRLDRTRRGTVAMWGSAAPHSLHSHPVSFSLWPSTDAVQHFAHNAQGHRHSVQRVQRSQHDLFARYSTASFEPYACEGTWHGSNRLANKIGAATT